MPGRTDSCGQQGTLAGDGIGFLAAAGFEFTQTALQVGDIPAGGSEPGRSADRLFLGQAQFLDQAADLALGAVDGLAQPANFLLNRFKPRFDLVGGLSALDRDDGEDQECDQAAMAKG